jgi:hypothetical protein
VGHDARPRENTVTYEAVFACTVPARVLLDAHIDKLLDATDVHRCHTVFYASGLASRWKQPNTANK